MNIHEPAAQIAEDWLNGLISPASSVIVKNIADRIRALPTPPSEPDLEKMQKALERAFQNQNNSAINFVLRDGANFLAAEGFRLGDAGFAFDMLAAKNEGYKEGIRQAALSSEAAIQSRIDAALREEREAILRALPAGQICDPQEIADMIRARTTTSEIAGGPSTPAKENAPASASAAGEDPAPKRKIIQVATQSAVDHVHDGYTLALADDGSLWWRGLNDPAWVEIPPIPSPEKSRE